METIQLLAATLLGPGLFAAVLLPALAHLNRSIEMEKNWVATARAARRGRINAAQAQQLSEDCDR
jgi:hypothetical protein